MKELISGDEHSHTCFFDARAKPIKLPRRAKDLAHPCTMIDRRVQQPGLRILQGLSLGGVGGTPAEPARGRAGAALRNPLFGSPPPAAAPRTRTPTTAFVPPYAARSSHGNRNIVEREDNAPETETQHKGGDLCGVRMIDVHLLSTSITDNFVCKECVQCPQLLGGAGKAVPVPAAAAVAGSTARMTRGSRSGLASCFTFECALGTRKGPGPVEAKLLLALEMARGIPHAAAREVQGRLLAGLEQRGDRILVSTFACRRRWEIIAVRDTPPGLWGAWCCMTRRI